MTSQNLVLSSSTIKGSPVENMAGEKLGHVEEIMMDVTTGETLYGVLKASKEFLDSTEKLFAIPFRSMRFDEESEKVRVDISRERLKDAPGFSKNDWPTNPQEAFIDKVYTYFGVERNQPAY